MRGASWSRAGLVIDVEERLVAPDGSQHRQSGLNVDTDVAGVNGEGERLGRREAGAEAAVDEKSPYVAEGDPLADQVFDVDSAVAQCAAVLVGFCDIAGEGDDAFESAHKIVRYCCARCHSRGLSSFECARSTVALPQLQ